jgi:hypothetical protein
MIEVAIEVEGESIEKGEVASATPPFLGAVSER